MKKILVVLLVLVFSGCSLFQGTGGAEQPTRKVYFNVTSSECFFWKDWRYSSSDFGPWMQWCEKDKDKGIMDIAKTVNPGTDFQLMLRADKADVNYRIYMNNKGTLESGVIEAGKEKEIKIKIE